MDDVAGESRRARVLPLFLSGLEAGMLGAMWMLAWMGVSSVFQRHSFWTAENLMATAFRRDASLGSNSATISGLALYLLLYSLLGALFAVAVRNRLPRVRTVLLSMAFGLAWYWVSFQWLWKAALPVVALLHVEQSTMLGHLVYGTVLGRYPRYLARLDPAPPAEPPAVMAPVREPVGGDVQPGPAAPMVEPPAENCAEPDAGGPLV